MDLGRPHRAIVPSLDGDVLLVLAGAEMALTGRHVARLVESASPAGVQRVLNRLVEHGLVLREPAGRASLFRLNRDHVAADVVVALAGLRTTLLARLRAALAAWDPVPVHASLFGSGARRTGSTDSDLDLLLVRADGAPADNQAWEAQVDALRQMAQRWTGNEVQIVELSESECADLAIDDHEFVASVRQDAVDLAGRPARLMLRGPADESRRHDKTLHQARGASSSRAGSRVSRRHRAV